MIYKILWNLNLAEFMLPSIKIKKKKEITHFSIGKK